MDEIDAALGTLSEYLDIIIHKTCSLASFPRTQFFASCHRFQERVDRGTLREGSDKGCPVYNHKVGQQIEAY